MEIINAKEKRQNESYDGANPWGCTHTHTQALLSVEEKNIINKFNRDSIKSRKIFYGLFLLSFYVVKNYKNLRKIGVLMNYE